MEFRILGSLEVVENGAPVEMGAQKHRALLAMLLLHANEVVSTDRLIDALWEDEPPPTAQKALQVYVSQLRKTLGKGRLETRAPGYRLLVNTDELDLYRFEQLLDSGRPEEALSLWRGKPLSDFAYSRFAQPEIARLEELRLAALESRIEQELAAGRHAQAIGELEALVQAHPLRERLRAQLMLALYRSGRQADALQAYQDGRRRLADELGLGPGRELREIERSILNQDPELDAPPEAGAVRPEETPARELRKTISALHVSVWMLGADGRPLDPEELRRRAESAFAMVEDAAQRHGGTVESRTGDAATAVFGLPIAHEDDAHRALRTALDVRRSLDDAAPVVNVDVRMAVSTGEVIAGAGRTVGAPLSVSAGLAGSAAPGELLLDTTTHRLLRDAVSVEDVGPGVRLVEAHDVPRPRRRSPMVGREREQRRLRDVYEQAVGDASCQLLTVLGSAGVGKSRLVEEILAGLPGAAVARGRCLPYGEGITYWPVMEAVKEAVGLADGEDPAVARSKLASALGGGADAEAVASRVMETIGLADAAIAVEEGFSAVRALFEGLARARPLVVVFDDIHWGEPTFLDLVEHLADRVRDVPMILVCLARPELLEGRPGWGGGKANATSILLEPLSDEDCGRLIADLAGAITVEGEVEARIVEAAEGNPLFAEEMLALVLEDGSSREDLVLPPTIQALLAARLDQLSPDERAALERAAVIGKVFYEGAVADLTSEGERGVLRAILESLVRKELVRPVRPSLGEPAYAFRHLLIRDAAYDSIPKEIRSALHEQFGRWLERAVGDRATEYEEIVGYHLEQAYRYRAELGPPDDAACALGREAARRLADAGRRAFVRSDAPAGVNLVSRAAALLPADDPARVDLVPNVRTVQGLSGDLVWADRVLTEAVEAAATTGDRRLAARALVQRGFLRLFISEAVEPSELTDVANRAIAVFEEECDDLGLARSWRLVAQAHYLDRRLAASADASERALVHARRAGDHFEEREIVEWLVIALLLGPADAGVAAERCRGLLAEATGDPLLEAELFGCLAAFTAMQDDIEGAQGLIAKSHAICEQTEEWVWIVTFWAAFVHMWDGDPAAAERELRPGYDALKRIGERSHFSSIAHALSNAVYMQDRLEEAAELCQECEKACRPNDVHSHVHWRSTRAKILARTGRPEEAHRLAQKAVWIAESGDLLPAQAEALMDFAEVLELAGDRLGAAAALRRASELWSQKGNVLMAEQTVARLTALA